LRSSAKFHARVDVLPQQGSGLSAISFRKKIRSLPRGADGDGILAHQPPFGVIAFRDDSERERQHERRQPEDGAGNRGDRRFLFILRPPVLGMPQAIPRFDGDHHDDDRAGEECPDGDGIDGHGLSTSHFCASIDR
jgi:hypothetical protein